MHRRGSAAGPRISLQRGQEPRGEVDPARFGDRGLQLPLAAMPGLWLYTRTARSVAVWRFSFRGVVVGYLSGSVAAAVVVVAEDGLFKPETERDNRGLLREFLDGGTTSDALLVARGGDLPCVLRSASSVVTFTVRPGHELALLSPRCRRCRRSRSSRSARCAARRP